MENKILDGLKTKGISESSLKLYLNNLKRLNGGQDIKNLSFLKNVDTVLDKIKDYKPNTRRTYLISIVSLLKQDPKQKKLYDKYYPHLMEYNKQLQVNNTKSEAQNENWISQDQVKEIYKKLEDDVKPFLSNKKITPEQYEKLLNYLILSLYTLHAPRRNMDYQKMVIINKYDTELSNKYNYLDLDTKEFKFNNYKTQKTYKTQTVPIVDELQKVITSYIKFHPLKKALNKKSGAIPFLVDFEGIPFESNNVITRILNKIFNKKIGSSMLRNIYLTDKFSDKVKELQDTAKDMGTSASTIQNNYIKLDDINKNLKNIQISEMSGGSIKDKMELIFPSSSKPYDKFDLILDC